jgi:hypothetical protein
VISTVDPDARHAHKTVERRTDGFTAHLCGRARHRADHQHPAHPGRRGGPQRRHRRNELLAQDPTLPGPVEVLADSAYGTGDALAALTAAGHTPVIKPWPLRPVVTGGFTGDDFTIDEAAGTATCPARVTRPISRTRIVTFGAACRGCPLRAACTTAPRGRSLHLHEHDALQRAHRVRAADPAFRTIYRRHRPMVERSIAWITRGHRRVPYRGAAKNDAWLHLRAAAINLRRLLTLGLTGTDGRWALAS